MCSFYLDLLAATSHGPDDFPERLHNNRVGDESSIFDYDCTSVSEF